MATTDDKNDLWKEALARLTEEDRREIKTTEGLKSLNTLHEAAEDQRKKCIKDGWSVYTKKDGTKVKLRHILEKIAGAADQIIELGTAGVGLDASGHAAAPWAVVKLLISGAASNINLFAELGEGLEMVSDMLARFAIVEKLYLDEDSDTTQQLREKLLGLYSRLLAYLAAAKRYFSASSMGKIGLGLVNSMSGRYKELASSLNEENVDKWIKLADARLQESRDKQTKVRHDILKQALDNVQQPVLRMVQQLSAVEDNLNDEKRRKILEWLSTINYQNHHTLGSKDLLSNSGLWLLESNEFVSWKSSPTSSALWLHGSAGTGKTSIVSKVIDHLKKDGSKQAACPIAYFYCSRNTLESERGDPDQIMSTILKQLGSSSSASEPIRQPVVAEYTSRRNGLSADATPQKLFAAESADICTQLCSVNPAYIVVDALDECDDLRRYELLEALDRVMSRSQETVKVFLSSRSDVNVSLHIHKSPLACVSIVSEKNQEDISRFVQKEVSRLSKKKLLLQGNLSSSLRKETIEVLKTGAQGMFRWVVLSLESLRLCRHPTDYKKRLGRLPPILSALYDNLFQEIKDYGEWNSQAVELVLSLLLRGVRPLTTGEVVGAVFSLSDGYNSQCNSDEEDSSDNTDTGSDASSDTDSDSHGSETDHDGLASPSMLPAGKTPAPRYGARRAQQIVGMCRNLVIIDAAENLFRFAHPSVREYIMALQDYRADRTHARLARRCMGELMRERLTQMTPHELVSQKYFRSVYDPEASRESFVRYAISWIKHSRRVSGTPAESEDGYNASLARFLFRGPDTSEGSLALRVYEILWIFVSKHSRIMEYIKSIGNRLPSVLIYAIRINSDVILDQVIARGCDDIDALDPDRRSALYYAAFHNRPALVNQLLDLGADPMSRRVLHIVARSGNTDVADVLLGHERGCDINALCDGFTPLMAAIEHNEHDMALHLMSKPGIDLSTPGLLALAATFIKSDALMRELLRRTSADPNMAARKGRTPLLTAMLFHNEPALKALLDDPRVHPAFDFISYGYYKETTAAIFFNHPRVDVNSRNEDGETALHVAVKFYDKVLIDFLLAHPAVKVDIRDNDNLTPLDYAVDRGHDDIVQLLEERLGVTSQTIEDQ